MDVWGMPPLPLQLHNASGLEQAATYFPHSPRHHGQLAQAEAVKEPSYMPQYLNGQATELVRTRGTLELCPWALLDPEGPQLSVMNDLGPPGGWVEPPLGERAAIVGQRTTVLHPAIEAGMDVTVDIRKVRGELVPAE